jgi:hypothetical protein
VFLGPPLPDKAVSRRDIAEYVDAMGAYFSRGRGHRRFVLRELRDGVLHQLSDEFHLPPDTTDVNIIVAALARRSQFRSESLRNCLAEIGSLLQSKREISAAAFLDLAQRLNEMASSAVNRPRAGRSEPPQHAKSPSTAASSRL